MRSNGRTLKSETISKARKFKLVCLTTPKVLVILNLEHSYLFRISKFGFRSSPRSFSPDHHKHILQFRQVHCGRELGLAVKGADLKAAHGSDEKAGGKNAAHTRSINFLARLQFGQFR